VQWPSGAVALDKGKMPGVQVGAKVGILRERRGGVERVTLSATSS
jgi:hypothetical protein